MKKSVARLKRAIGALAAALLLCLGVWLSLPPLLKWQAEFRATQAVGRDVRIGSVEVQPWKLDFVLREIQIAGVTRDPVPANAVNPTVNIVPGKVPLLTLGRLRLDFAWASLWKGAPVLEAVELDGMRLSVSRVASGHYDIDDLIQRLSPAPGAPSTPPIQFALHNVQLRDAAVVFDDRPASRVHTLNALRFAIPSLSNLPSDVDIKVQPRLSFVLNGVPFDSGAIGTPFAKTRSGELKLRVVGLDVVPYLGYLPTSLPVRVKAGTLTTDLALDLDMPPSGAPTVKLHGSLTAASAELTDSQGAPLLAWRRLDLDLRSLVPLARQVAISSLRIEGARLAARKDAKGTISLLSLGLPPSRSAEAPAATAPPAPTGRETTRNAPADWHVALDRLSFADAGVAWTDASVEPRAALRVERLNAEFGQLAWPIVRPVSVAATGWLRADPSGEADASAFSIDGTASDRAANLKLSLASLPLETLAAYLDPVLIPRLAGRLSARARLDWAVAGSAPIGPVVTIDDGTIDEWVLRERTGPGSAGSPRELAAVQRLAVTDARIDVSGQAVTVGRLAVDRPSMSIARDKEGRWDFERWTAAATAPSARTTSPAKANAAPWRILIQETVLTGGRFQLNDAQPAGATAANPLRVAVDDLRVAIQALDWRSDRPTVPAQIALSGRVGPPRAPDDKASQAGSFDWRGVVGIAPVLLTGSLRVERLPAHLFAPYAGPGLGLRLARAEFGYAGSVSVKQLAEGWDVDAGADLLLGAVRLETASAAGAETLLSWNTLGLTGARVSMKPHARPKIDIAEAALDDFYARLLVTEEGRLNLSSVGGPVAGDAPPQSPPASAASAAVAGALAFDLRLESTALTHGRLDFSDHFVRPNYSAALTELTGRLGALRSDRPEIAALTLRGKAAGTAVLDISGTVNPLARPPTLDLHAKATDLELAPLSPYAGKYAGYAIERGKLSVDVSYRLGTDGRLDAKNQVVLNQLTFGRKIDSPVATRLPVLLAVALLKDRNGVIDLDLPISGSLDDPQFSVAAIVGRLLSNLLVKAITSPFALLSGGASGNLSGSDPGRVEFLPGSTRLAGAGLAAIEKVAESLAGKPSLMLTVTGSADPVTEREAYRSAVLEDRLEAVRRKETVASAAAASAPEPALGAVARGRLLKELYADSDLQDKPRNALGFAKDVPAAEMEARLKAIVPTDADTMRALALQRGVNVRDALIDKGLSSTRIFLAEPQLRSPEAGAASGGPPRAELSLSVD